MPNEELVRLRTMAYCPHSCVLSLSKDNTQCGLKFVHLRLSGLTPTYDVVAAVMLSSLLSTSTQRNVFKLGNGNKENVQKDDKHFQPRKLASFLSHLVRIKKTKIILHICAQTFLFKVVSITIEILLGLLLEERLKPKLE
jgi:hypothetical protein